MRQRPTRPQNKARLQASYSTRGESPLLRDEISPLSAVRLDRVSGLLILLLCVLLCRHQNEERERQEPARRSHGVCEGAPQAPVLVRCSCPEAASSDLDHRRLEIVSLPLVISLIPALPRLDLGPGRTLLWPPTRFQPQALSAGTSLANSSREGRQGAGRGARSGFRQYCAGGSTRSATNRASRLPRGPRVEQLPKTAR